MNLIKIILAFALLTQLSGCAIQTDFTKLGEQNGEERRLLVTFVDQTINRNLNGNAQDGYRSHGQYSNSGWSERLAQQLAERYQLQFIAQWPVTELGVSCVVYEVPGNASVQQVISRLQSDKEVAVVQPMQSFKVLGDPQSRAPAYSDPYLKLQTGFQSLDIAERHKTATGRGIRIAVIDSGVDIDHPDLKGQISHSENLAPEPSNHDLADWHGTAVAGVLSARPNNGIGIAGIAPDAEIMALRACWPEKPGALAAHCNSFTLALALNQALRLDSQIINLSLSGPEDPLLKMLIEKALSKGILVVAAVSGDEAQGSFPASMPGVIAVGRGGELQPQAIIAPGRDILTTVPHQAYDFMTGSSFATPHVAGMIALLLQQHPDWHSGDIKYQLQHDLNASLSTNVKPIN